MELINAKGKELCLMSLKMASIMATNPDNTLQVMYQRVGDEFLCIVKKYGSKTNPDEAITVSPEEYVKGFKKCVKEHWFFNFFKDNKIITWR